MAKYEWFDIEIEVVIHHSSNENLIEMIFREEVGAVVIHKDDVIALAKMFDLVVYEKDANLCAKVP